MDFTIPLRARTLARTPSATRSPTGSSRRAQCKGPGALPETFRPSVFVLYLEREPEVEQSVRRAVSIHADRFLLDAGPHAIDPARSPDDDAMRRHADVALESFGDNRVAVGREEEHLRRVDGQRSRAVHDVGKVREENAAAYPRADAAGPIGVEWRHTRGDGAAGKDGPVHDEGGAPSRVARIRRVVVVQRQRAPVDGDVEHQCPRVMVLA